MHNSELQSALSRMQVTREALRRELVPVPDNESLHPSAGGHASLSHMWRKLRRLARRWPVTAMASKVLQSWWRLQPWSGTSELLAGSLLHEGRPLVRKHPVGAMAVAALAGGLLVAFRPWRWVLAELRRLPMQTAWATLLVETLLESQQRPAAERSDEHASSDADTQPAPAP